MAMVYCKDHVLIYTMHTNQDHSTTVPFSFFLLHSFLMPILYSLSVQHHSFSQAWCNLKGKRVERVTLSYTFSGKKKSVTKIKTQHIKKEKEKERENTKNLLQGPDTLTTYFLLLC